MTVSAQVIDDIIAAFEAQGMQVDQYYPELGHGQQELPIRHAPALRAADNQVFYRETVRNVAYQHSLYASLAPKAMARSSRQRSAYSLQSVGYCGPEECDVRRER